MIPSSVSPEKMDHIQVRVQRPALTVHQKHKNYYYNEEKPEDLCTNIKRKVAKKTKCSSKTMKNSLLKRIPVIKWLPEYNIKTDLVGDLIAGLTVAVMHIPQGMAYAMLAGLLPIHGIYMAFFPVLTYAIFGTSKHCSIGTFAVICIMTGKVVNELSIPTDPLKREIFLAEAAANNITAHSAAEVATICSFAVALWMMVLGVFQLGTLSVFFSDMLVSGFTTGASIHVLTSQLKHLFGLNIPRFSGPFKILRTYKSLFELIMQSNIATLMLSAGCITTLVINNEVVKPRLAKYTRFPIPIELIIVLIGTLASNYGEFEKDYKVITVGKIPTGLPSPKLPPFDLFGTVLVDSLIIAIVSYTISYAMAKILAKDQYKVNATQELYAHSMSNLVGSFFACAPVSTSLSRSLIQTAVGGVSQVTSFISCSLLLLVLLFIGPFFQTLPNCVLAAIILAALKGMLLKVNDLITIAKVSLLDASIWLLTFLTVVIVDIDYGLFVGIVISIVILIIRNQTPHVAVLGKISDTDMYLDKEKYIKAQEIPEFMICGVTGSLHYANQTALRKMLSKKTTLDPKKKVTDNYGSVQTKIVNNNGSVRKEDSSYSQTVYENGQVVNDTYDTVLQNGNQSTLKNTSRDKDNIISSKARLSIAKSTVIVFETKQVKYLIIDLSGVGQIDASAGKNLDGIYDDYAKANITVAYTGISDRILQSLQEANVLKKIPNNLIFHSIQDAINILSATPVEESGDELTVHL